MSELRGIYIIWYRELLRLWRNKTRIVGSIASPLLFLLVFGGGLSRTIGSLEPGVNYAKFMFPGVIGMAVLMTAFMSGLSVVWDREFGFLKEVLVAPVSRSSVVLGKILGGASIAMFQGLLVLAFYPVVGLNLTAIQILKLLPLMLLVACALGSLGILIASRMKSMESFQIVMQTTVFPMIFLSGAFFPVGNLPSWLNALVKINPVTYAIAPIRQLLLSRVEIASASSGSTITLSLYGHPMSIGEEVAIVFGFGLVMTGLSIWAFNLQE